MSFILGIIGIVTVSNYVSDGIEYVGNKIFNIYDTIKEIPNKLTNNDEKKKEQREKYHELANKIKNKY